MKLSEIVSAYFASLPAGIVLDRPNVERLLKSAVRFYCGYSTLRSQAPDAEARELVPVQHTPIDATNSISGNQDFDLNPSEYALIKPLFMLYVEHENAQNLEASRAMGLDVYGRAVSEVSQDIRQMEMDMPRMAFFDSVVTV